MLDGAGNADGDVELRRDDLAGLADLIVIGRIAGVDRGAAGADGGAELVGERVEQAVELLVRAEGAAARDDDLGADVSSGRSLFDISAETNSDLPSWLPASTVSTVPEPPSRAAFSKAVPRTVMTFLASFDLTVAMALPA